MTKNKIKKLSIVALTGLVAVGAYAFIKDSRVQSGTNLIKPGVISITFDNEANAISLSGNDAIPMRAEYAKSNITPYKFDIVNDGDVELDYAIKLDNVNSTFNNELVHILLGEVGDENMDDQRVDMLYFEGEYYGMKEEVKVAPGETHSYQLIPYLDGDFTTLLDYKDKNISFGLKVEATQSVPYIEGFYLRTTKYGAVEFLIYDPSINMKDGTSWNYETLRNQTTSLKINGNEFVGTSYLAIGGRPNETTKQMAAMIGTYSNAPDTMKPVVGENTYSLTYNGHTYRGTFNYNNESTSEDILISTSIPK